MYIEKPLLAADVDDVEALDFGPGFLATPKIDGIRCILTRKSPFGSVLSRTYKPIPNQYIVSTLTLYRKMELDFDGELVAPGGNFQDSTSLVMRRGGSPAAFRYYIFDCLGSQGGDYVERLNNLYDIKFPHFVQVLKPEPLHSLAGFQKYEARCLKQGYEGVMLRRPHGLYKFGRSTLNEEILLKVKRWRDAEAVIEGVEPFYANQNVSKANHLGYLKKSSKKSGKYKLARLGAFIVRDVESGKQFTVGSGLTDEQRKSFWRDRAQMPGQVIKYKFLPKGVKDLPRHPIFVGFRDLNF